MYLAFDPVLVYGVAEKAYDKVICESFLELHGVQAWPTYIAKGYAGNFVYDVCVLLEDVKSGNISAGDREKVAKFVAALMEKGVNRGELEVYLAISSGNYERCHKEYLDADDEGENNNKKTTKGKVMTTTTVNKKRKKNKASE